MTTKTDKILADLTAEQSTAVTSTHPRILCLAGAGSGKTRVLTHRVAHLISEGYGPSSLLVVTFTVKAAQGMKERIEALVGRENVRSLWIGTFHSVCLRMLNSWGRKLGFTPPVTVYDETDRVDIANHIITTKHKADVKPDALIEEIHRSWNRQKILNPAHLCLVNEYIDILIKSNAVDFDGLLASAETLLGYDEIQANYHNRFKHILVDEYQDTNPVQQRIIDLIDPENLFVVGDDQQAIYRFRGADPNIFLNFGNQEETEVVQLTVNYRSLPDIVRAGDNLISHNTLRLDKKVVSSGRDGGGLMHVSHDWLASIEAEASFILKEIQENHTASLGNVAILSRTHRQLREIETALVNAKIPYNRVRRQDFWTTEPARVCLAFLRVIANPFDDWSMGYILRVLCGLMQIDMADLKAHKLEDNLTLLGTVGKYCTGALAKIPWFVAEAQIAERAGPMYASEIIESILADIDIEGFYVAQLRTSKAAMYEDVHRSLVKWEDEHPRADYLDFLNWISQRMLADQLKPDENKVTLATVHAAKGLEWPVVFIVSMHDGGFPYSKAATFEDYEEERRIAYVAISRAADRLYLTTPGEDVFGRSVYESPFLDEMRKEKTDGKDKRA